MCNKLTVHLTATLAQPEPSTSAEVGDALTLSCKIEPGPVGISPTNYWQLNGGSLPSGTYTYIREDEDGITSFLVFFSITGAMDGSYISFISFYDDQVIESAPAIVSVEGIKSFPTAARGVINNKVVITCVASGDSYATNIAWFKDGTDIATLGLGSLSSPGELLLTFYKWCRSIDGLHLHQQPLVFGFFHHFEW